LPGGRSYADNTTRRWPTTSKAVGPSSTHIRICKDEQQTNVPFSTAASLASAKVQFDTIAKGLRWLGTNGLRITLQFWFTKTAMFWIPRGWLPSYVEWALSFPRAPTGSVSIQVWGIACASVVQLVHQAVVASYLLTTVGVHPAEANKGMAFDRPQQGMPGATRAGKKDL